MAGLACYFNDRGDNRSRVRWFHRWPIGPRLQSDSMRPNVDVIAQLSVASKGGSELRLPDIPKYPYRHMVWPCNLTRLPQCHLPPCHFPFCQLLPFCQLPASPQIEDVASNCQRASTVYETDQEK